MTEREWLECIDPEEMIFSLEMPYPRKLGLYECACCRLVWPHLTDERSRNAVEIAEQYHDDQVGEDELEAARLSAEAAYKSISGPRRGKDAARAAAKAASEAGLFDAPEAASWVAAWDGEPARAAARKAQADILRNILGPLPFRPVRLLRSWRTPAVVALARHIYNARTFHRLPELADLLESAGCRDAENLGHCRGPGPHTRGCWPLDLVLAKE